MLSITGFGLAAGAGGGRAALLAAGREGAPAFRGHRRFFDSSFNPAVCAFRDVGRLAAFTDRIPALVAEALADCGVARQGPLMAHLVLPAPDGGLSTAQIAQVEQDIAALLQTRLPVTLTDLRRHPGAQAGLGHAIAASADSPVPHHLIIAADSFCDRGRMDHLLATDRLMSQRNPWGIVPGEAAGVLWLRHGGDAGQGRIAGLGLAHEDVPEDAEAETDYRALSLAVREACKDAEPRAVAGWWADANNSRYRAAEVAHALVRAAPFWLMPGVEPDYPALAFGDCGAASGLTALHCALASGVGAGLITLSAPGGARSAIRLTGGAASGPAALG